MIQYCPDVCLVLVPDGTVQGCLSEGVSELWGVGAAVGVVGKWVVVGWLIL